MQTRKRLFLALPFLFPIFGCENELVNPNQNPTVQIVENPGELVVEREVSFSWAGTDEDGEIAGYYYDIDNSVPSTWTTSTSVTLTVDPGTHVFFIKSKDDDDAESEVESFRFDYIRPTITISAPGGSQWELGTTQMIRWTSEAITSEVGIDLFKEDVFYQTIVNRTINNGEYAWDIPDNLPPGMDYNVKIYDGMFPTRYAFSRYHFRLYSTVKSIRIVHPVSRQSNSDKIA